MAEKNKYNNRKAEVDGVEFDSLQEARYYRHIRDLKREGDIKDFELQPEFTLIPKFEKFGKKFRPTRYIADFKVIENDGSVRIIDIKGFETADFKIKKKLFEWLYPDLSLECLTYVAKRGGWITLDDNAKAKREEKKKKV